VPGARAKTARILAGQWDLTWPGEKEGDLDHGINSVLRVLDGCAIEQNFSGGVGMHLRGRTLLIFDTASDKWKQTWLDNDGGYLNFTCEFKDGQMILAPRPCGATVRRSVNANWAGAGGICRRRQDLADQLADSLQKAGRVARLSCCKYQYI